MRRLLGVTAAIAACLAAFSQPANAATEVGSRCAANASTSEVMLVTLATPPGTLPAAIPSAGVITRWSFALGLPIPPEVSLSETLKVFRQTGAPNQVQVVAESPLQFVVSGNQTFPVRIPVLPGDLIGALAAVSGGTGAVFCETANPGDVVGVVPDTAPVGAVLPVLAQEQELQNPIVVTVEPDADGDGFGDESQDACPQSATTQAACPVVKLSVSTTAKKKLVTVLVTSPIAANVTVNGVVSLGKGKKAKLKGGTKGVAPGAFTKFKLKFNSALSKRLQELPPSKKLTLKITSTAPNVVGAATKKVVRVKLKGQG
jgi:hypothetical protein